MRTQRIRALWLGLAASVAMVLTGAALAFAHAPIALRGPDGNILTDNPAGPEVAFSTKQTCGLCHDYDRVEQHSYHTQLAANQLFGWNNWNPDSPNTFKSGPAPKGKNWVQSPGHVGKW
ncbi:MAG: cytochrome c [Geothermobacteraceae bacterium]